MFEFFKFQTSHILLPTVGYKVLAETMSFPLMPQMVPSAASNGYLFDVSWNNVLPSTIRPAKNSIT
jgi:hypothetical protein